jgi:hypothetical protein
MASSTLTSKSFLDSSRIDTGSLSSAHLRKLSFSSVQISSRSRLPKKLRNDNLTHSINLSLSFFLNINLGSLTLTTKLS